MNFQNQIEYSRYFNIDILGGVSVPEPLDNDLMKNVIVERCGLLTPVFSEPETMSAAISVFFRKNQYAFKKITSLLETEYLPLENYRRTETEERNTSGTRSQERSDNENITTASNSTENETTSDTGTITDEYSNSVEKTVSAYNESEYSPDEKTDSSGDNVRTLDTERARDMRKNGNETIVKNGGADISETSSGAETIKRVVYGNIGTMTAQDMYNQELDLIARFNPYEWICDKLERELFLAIW